MVEKSWKLTTCCGRLELEIVRSVDIVGSLGLKDKETKSCIVPRSAIKFDSTQKPRVEEAFIKSTMKA
jgi:hypothetical protein